MLKYKIIGCNCDAITKYRAYFWDKGIATDICSFYGFCSINIAIAYSLSVKEKMYRKIKFALDKIFAFIALVCLMPLFVVIAIAIKIEDGQSVFLKQERCGYKQKTFNIYKFRTMTKTDIVFDPSNPVVEGSSEVVTIIGAFLRRFKLDELPQLLNILKGDMSIIGTRPLLPCYLEDYEEWELAKFNVRPGLSGYAQVCGNGHLSRQERSYYDIIYGHEKSLLLDIIIVFRTIYVVVCGEEKYIKHVSNRDMNNLKNLIKRKPENKIKVAHIVGNISLGGVSRSVLNYCNHLNQDDFALDFYVFGNGAIEEEFLKLGNVYELPSFINFPVAMYKFYNYLKLTKYDIVHSNLTTLSFFPLLVAKLMGVKVRICHAHSTSTSYDIKRLFKAILRPLSAHMATIKIACSKDTAKWSFRSKHKEAIILNNAIDLDSFAYKQENAERILSQYPLNGHILGFAGRFSYQKNILFMIDVIAELNRIKPCTLVLVGDGEDKQKILEKIKALNLENLVVFMQPTPKINEIYSAFDTFIMTSRYEGLPLVGIEALANGLPLVLSDCITQELGSLGTVEYLSLAEHASAWAQAIASTPIARKDNLDALINAGYDIKTQASILAETYYSAIETSKGQHSAVKITDKNSATN